MKPLLLELQAFGPFVEKQTVNFDELSKSGIFLIKGETGSGKTTIFDAMTFALYGGGSGTDEKIKVGRNDFEEWRCSQAPDSLETYVLFEFSSRGKKYRFTRKLVPKRINLSYEYGAGEIDENGNEIPFFNNPKAADLKDKAEELIGLTKEQFRQVVLLPQGQFERFLTAPSDEKTLILNKIFNTDIWAKYADNFYASADLRKKTLEREKLSVDASLTEEGAADIEALKDKIAGLNTDLSGLDNAHKEFDGKTRQEELNEAIKLSEKFKPFHDLQKTKAALDSRLDEINEKQNIYEAAEKAEKIRPFIEKHDKAREDFNKRNKDLSNKENLLPSVKDKAEKAKNNLDSHEKNSIVASLNAKIGEYESKRESYESFTALKSSLENADKAYNAAKSASDAATKAFSDLKDKAAADYKKYESLLDEAKSCRTKYYEGIYGEIAGTLKENEKCPVCGSVSHPAPAEKSPDSISKQQVDEKEKAAENAKKTWSDAEDKRETAEKDKNNKESALKDAEDIKTNLQAKFDAAKNSLIEGIADTKALEKAIKAVNDEINAYNEKGKEQQRIYEKAKKDLDELNTQIETAKQEKETAKIGFETAEKALKKALDDGGYLDADSAKCLLMDADKRALLHEEITSYKTKRKDNLDNLAIKEQELAGIEEPDSSKFEERQREISEESENYNTNSANLKQDIERLNQKHANLSEKLDLYNGQIKSAEDDMAFARKLRGDTGIGIQRYVLAIMFNQVIGEANEMLKKIHGGRYSLFRSDDRGKGNKRGLELKVHDSRSPEKEGRSVSMLSGGEKFLVSLALSIGMSSVAQKSGVQIEALFIDEGFGTLDKNSISDAMDVLDSVRKTNSMIGIISHVEFLEENIPTQIEVVKSESGNRIKTV